MGAASLPLIKALCVGSAACLHDDLARADELGVTQDNGWSVLATNHAGRDWPGVLEHWVTFHPELLPRWLADRRMVKLPEADAIWTVHNRVVPKPVVDEGLAVGRAANWAGSSGLLAVTVALEHLCANKVVLAGIPLDYEQGHYDDPLKKWRDAVNYRKGWVRHHDDMVNVRSLSGWTAGLLGLPTREWLAAEPVPRDDSPAAHLRRSEGRR